MSLKVLVLFVGIDIGVLSLKEIVIVWIVRRDLSWFQKIVLNVRIIFVLTLGEMSVIVLSVKLGIIITMVFVLIVMMVVIVAMMVFHVQIVMSIITW